MGGQGLCLFCFVFLSPARGFGLGVLQSTFQLPVSLYNFFFFVGEGEEKEGERERENPEGSKPSRTLPEALSHIPEILT